MSLVAHDSSDFSSGGSRVANAAAPTFAAGKALLTQSLRMLLALVAITAVVVVAAGAKLAIWLPLYLR